MATLTLEVRSAADGSIGSVDLVIEIVPVGGRGARLAQTVAVATGRVREIRDLSPGPWEVRVVTPAGRMISREVDIDDDGSNEVVRIRLDGPADDRPTRRKPGSGRPRGLFPDGYLTKSFPSPGIRSLGVPFGAGVSDSVDTRVRVLRGPEIRRASDDEALAAWTDLARCVEGDLTPDRALRARAVGSGTGPDADELVRFPGVQEGRRIFAVATRGGRRRLHAVPVPFRIHGASGDVVLNRDGVQDGRLTTRVALRDARYAGVVAYLANGDLAAATALLGRVGDDVRGEPLDELAVGILRGKMASPLGACAAGYVLLGGDFASGPSQNWHEWIGNLCRMFDWIPDGAIIAARLMLLRAGTEEEARSALGLLREAVLRGLPFYSVGLGWLLGSMRHFPDDPLLAAAASLIQRVAVGLDMDEPFTTLDLGDTA